MTFPDHCIPVPLAKAYRLMNHGPVVLVSSAHGDTSNVMAAAWAMPLDFDPPKLMVVIDKATLTRQLVEASGTFALNIPCVAMAAQTLAVGTDSARTVPAKLAQHGITTFAASQIAAPLVQGCVAWLECRVLPEPHNQGQYDLFIAEVLAAWADERVFSDGRWHFDTAPDALRTLHYVAGGQFYATGASVQVEK
ncbi:MAG: flavin reductase family protein [Rhodoferax sp.]|uniref:flavin reductase family protein n=1 Tax=Rhodoferax sp. TaxID=50421 RepID=UPI003266C6FF